MKKPGDRRACPREGTAHTGQHYPDSMSSQLSASDFHPLLAALFVLTLYLTVKHFCFLPIKSSPKGSTTTDLSLFLLFLDSWPNSTSLHPGFSVLKCRWPPSWALLSAKFKNRFCKAWPTTLLFIGRQEGQVTSNSHKPRTVVFEDNGTCNSSVLCVSSTV